MVGDGSWRTWDGEPQDWWMTFLGMAPCQALMSLYTVNRRPSSPECVSVFTPPHSFSLSLLLLFSSLQLLTSSADLHLHLHAQRFPPTASSLKYIRTNFEETHLQLLIVLPWKRETMPQQMFLLSVVSMWLLAGYFPAEATYYNDPLYNRHLYNYRHRTHNHYPSMDNRLHPEVEVPPPRSFHGIMFDAGSTGTRIHIYKFIEKDPGELFSLYSLSPLLLISFRASEPSSW